jgi:hemolysin III
MTSAAPPYSRPEELVHALTAGLGILACAVAIPWLAWVSFGDPWRLATALVFGATALGMFVTSVFYHWAREPETKIRLRKLDHSAIYLLIAGTYTPLTLVAMAQPWGWMLFGAAWILALLGVVAKTTLGFRYPRLSLILYVGMGWMSVLALRPIIAALDARELGWLIAGGVVYTAGVPFYMWKSRPYTHAIWHLFVLGGVACHFMVVWSLVDVSRVRMP